MKYLKKIAILGFFFFLGCEGGLLNSGLGSEKFLALAERMNSDVRLKQSSIQQLQSGSRFVEFEIQSIESVERINNNEANVRFPEYDIKTDFNRAEIIIADVRISDDEGNSFITTVTYLFGTLDEYYSESDFPVDNLLSITEYPPIDGVGTRLFVNYYHFGVSFGLARSLNGTLDRSGNSVSFKFSQLEFLLFTRDLGIVDESTIGSGAISSEKITRLSGF